MAVKTINREANALSKLFSDLDRYRRLYSLKEKHIDETINVQFVSPRIQAFEDFRFTLLKESVIKPLSPKNYYRPDYVSFEEYGTTNFWSLLLFINDVPTIEDFDIEEIIVPTTLVLSRMSLDIAKRDLLSEIVPLYELPIKETASLYYQKKNIPNTVEQTETAPIIPPDLYFNRETFTVDTVMSRQRYVDLLFEPVEESVILNVQGGVNYLYGKHYALVKGTKGKNRLTWDSRLITNGSGMVDIMIEGVVFEVLYSREIS
jgi:hypothetical protein